MITVCQSSEALDIHCHNGQRNKTLFNTAILVCPTPRLARVEKAVGEMTRTPSNKILDLLVFYNALRGQRVVEHRLFSEFLYVDRVVYLLLVVDRSTLNGADGRTIDYVFSGLQFLPVH